MIKNERQFKITHAQAEKFRRAASDLRSKSDSEKEPEQQLKLKLQLSAIESQLSDLDSDLRDYENLQQKRNESMEISSFSELPSVLIKARIASRLSQKQLADKLGLKEQQIQRYEATEYAGASLQRIQQIIDALGVKARKQLFIPEIPVTKDSIFSRLEQLGLGEDFVQRKLISRKLRASLESGLREQELEGLLFNSVANISRIFNWEPSHFLSSLPLEVNREILFHTRFKMPASSSTSKTAAYTVYAHFLALLLVQATQNIICKPVPASWRHVRGQIIERFGEVTLLNIVRYAWDLGVVVLPLKDAGHFHGATWRIRGRNVIVIKQKTQSEARWIIDLLHELWHAAQNPELPEQAVIEAEPPYANSEQLMEEQIATDFAADVVFKGRADELAEECAAVSNRRMEWLKSAVQKVALKHSVRVDLLANYLAYRLSLEGQNWWGTATRLQGKTVDPWQQVRDFVVANLNWEALSTIDRELLSQALETQELEYAS